MLQFWQDQIETGPALDLIETSPALVQPWSNLLSLEPRL